MRLRRMVAGLGALTLLLAGCGDDGGGGGTETTPDDREDFGVEAVTVVPEGGQDASLAAVGNPTVLLAWGEVGTSGEEADDRGYVRAETGGGVFVARSEDQGKTFSDPVRIDVDDPAADEGFSTSTRNDRPPRLVTTPNGDVHVVWLVTAAPEGDSMWPKSDLRIATSTDDGETFGPPRPVVDQELSPGFYGVFASSSGNLHVGFLGDTEDEDAIGSSVRVATSKDGGETFTVSDEFTDSTCQCCPVSFTEDSSGRLTMGWRQIYPVDDGTIRDQVVAFSDDEGETWSEWDKIHDDQWLLEQCPHSGPQLGYDSDDRLHAAWYTGKEDGPGIYYAKSEAGGPDFDDAVALLTDDFYPIVEPDLVVTEDDTVWITFGDDREETPAVWVARIDPDGTTTLSDEPVAEGRYPRLTLSGDQVLVSYENDGAVDVAAIGAG